MAHPWFNKKTPSIVYVPAPSVTELAKPLASEAHIDDELLESLCVIWGKHADVQGIKVDLLSPQGEGTLAKAFYFLLHEYREQTLKDRGIILDVDEARVSLSGKVVTKQYRSPSQKRSNRLDTSFRFRRLHTSRDAPPPPSRSPSPNPSPTDAPLPTSAFRSRTPSPVGPRPQRPRPKSSPVAESPTRHKSMTIKPVAAVFPNAHAEQARTRSSTVTMLSPRIAQDSHNYHAHNQQMYQPMHIPGTPPVAVGPLPRMTPMMVPTAWFPVSSHSPHSAGPVISPSVARAAPMSMIRRMGVSEVQSAPTSPRTGEYDMSIEPRTPRRFDSAFTYYGNDPYSPEGRPTLQVYREDTLPHVDRSLYSQAPVRHVTLPTSPEDAYQSARGQENKENGEHYEGRYAYQEGDSIHTSGGLFGKPRAGGRVGRELRNSLHGVEFLKRDGKERERDRKYKGEPSFVSRCTRPIMNA